MKMLMAGAVVALGALVVVGGLSSTTDLRGWPTASAASTAVILQPARPGDPAFTISDCLPWTVDLYASPRSSDYQGSATETLVACRSHSSFVRWLAVYGLLTASIGLVWKMTFRRKRRPTRDL